jgi:hypothetical protein
VGEVNPEKGTIWEDLMWMNLKKHNKRSFVRMSDREKHRKNLNLEDWMNQQMTRKKTWKTGRDKQRNGSERQGDAKESKVKGYGIIARC